ncbi:hypothetical protein C5B85_09620 [Pseudoclavibacter sp. AY1F1]|nr:hypothetical protein C5B85_09620 [Pseudoclavibacter sp. AY1F1]
MRHADFIDATEKAAASFGLLLETADLAMPVPSCPGWSLADLAAHLGGVHRWARAQLLGGGEQVDRQAPDAPLGDRDAFVAWFREGAAELVGTLRELPADAACWALYPPARASTWAKRSGRRSRRLCTSGMRPKPSGSARPSRRGSLRPASPKSRRTCTRGRSRSAGRLRSARWSTCG